MNEALRGTFHYRDGWYWGRSAAGDVELYRSLADRDLELVLMIDEASWASIVCSVSAEGETGERWQAAREFHGIARKDTSA